MPFSSYPMSQVSEVDWRLIAVIIHASCHLCLKYSMALSDMYILCDYYSRAHTRKFTTKRCTHGILPSYHSSFSYFITQSIAVTRCIFSRPIRIYKGAITALYCRVMKIIFLQVLITTPPPPLPPCPHTHIIITHRSGVIW